MIKLQVNIDDTLLRRCIALSAELGYDYTRQAIIENSVNNYIKKLEQEKNNRK